MKLSSYATVASFVMVAACSVAVSAAGTPNPRHISGTITAVHGHLVTIQQSRGTIVINDQPALNAKTTGNVATGRQVVVRGYWRAGTFFATAFQFAPSAARVMRTGIPDRISGTITSVRGHLVTLQQSRGPIVINDQPALDNKATGKVAVGRQVVADGYWHAGTFYATALQFGLAQAKMREADSVSGTITAVSGHLVTLQQSRGTLVINDQAALNEQTTGSVGVGRQVVALGYWLRGTFYATSINDAGSTSR